MKKIKTSFHVGVLAPVFTGLGTGCLVFCEFATQRNIYIVSSLAVITMFLGTAAAGRCFDKICEIKKKS